VDTPAPAAGQVPMKVTASGLCHSEEHVMSLPRALPCAMPQTLGHEPAGVVAELGTGVTGIEVGTAVVVYAPHGRGVGAMCADGGEQLCRSE